jgi:probable DNA metabolism protein
MPERRALIRGPQQAVRLDEVCIYEYDGSFDGLMCCVFESYEKNELPMDVLPEGAQLPMLLTVKTIETDDERAERVKASIPKSMGKDALEFVRNAYLTCHPQKELLTLKFLRLGFGRGPSVMDMLTDETVHTLFTAVNHLKHEAHLYTGFIRFSETNGVLTSQIEPKNIVLPLISRHFCERFPGERFLIYDKTHGMALLYENGNAAIRGIEAFEQPDLDGEELKFRELWRLFYDTIEIKERRNPRCRMSHMPKRYWSYMTEFAREAPKTRSLSHAPGKNGGLLGQASERPEKTMR